MKSNIFIKLITRNSKQIIALASGITMGLTVAPVGAWFLAWFAMIPLWLIVIVPKNKNKSLRREGGGRGEEGGGEEKRGKKKKN